MKKVIVFKVENVLVKDYDEKKVDEGNFKKVLKVLVGEDFFKNEFKENGKVMGIDKMKEKLARLEESFEACEDEVKKFWLRDVIKKMREWENGKEERLVKMRKEYLDGGFEKKQIGLGNDLKDLERICGVTGSNMVFLTEGRKRMVENLLINNGLRRFEVVSDLGFLEGVGENDYVVFDSVESLGDIWRSVGLRRG